MKGDKFLLFAAAEIFRGGNSLLSEPKKLRIRIPLILYVQQAIESIVYFRFDRA